MCGLVEVTGSRHRSEFEYAHMVGVDAGLWAVMGFVSDFVSIYSYG